MLFVFRWEDSLIRGIDELDAEVGAVTSQDPNKGYVSEYQRSDGIDDVKCRACCYARNIERT